MSVVQTVFLMEKLMLLIEPLLVIHTQTSPMVLNVNLGYKNWDLTVFAQGVQGNEIFNYLKYWTDFNTFQGNRSTDMLYKSWKKQGDVAQLPRLNASDTFSQQISTYFVEDGSYLRIKNIQLTYNCT